MLYKKIDKNSAEAIPSGLLLFDMPLTQVAIEKSEDKEFLPLNPIDLPPFNFIIHTGTQYMDPRSLRVLTRWSLTVKGKGEDEARKIKKTTTKNPAKGEL